MVSSYQYTPCVDMPSPGWIVPSADWKDLASCSAHSEGPPSDCSDGFHSSPILSTAAVTLVVGCRRIGWVSFWAQLALTVVSAVVLSFTVGSSMQVNNCFTLHRTIFATADAFLAKRPSVLMLRNGQHWPVLFHDCACCRVPCLASQCSSRLVVWPPALCPPSSHMPTPGACARLHIKCACHSSHAMGGDLLPIVMDLPAGVQDAAAAAHAPQPSIEGHMLCQMQHTGTSCPDGQAGRQLMPTPHLRAG